MKANTCLILTVLSGFLGAVPCQAQTAGAGEGVPERVAALKQSLAQSQKSLRTYEWIETTTVSLNGEQKSMKQERCYYGADGGLQKVPIDATPPPAKKRGLRGAIAASKKEELTDTMKQAVGLVRSYVPPDPLLIQRAVDSGKVSIDILQPGKVVRLVFRDYRLPGDTLGITVELATNHVAGINVASYLGQPSNPVGLDARLGALADGTTYPANIQLAVKSQGLGVNVVNSGYRKLGAM